MLEVLRNGSVVCQGRRRDDGLHCRTYIGGDEEYREAPYIELRRDEVFAHRPSMCWLGWLCRVLGSVRFQSFGENTFRSGMSSICTY